MFILRAESRSYISQLKCHPERKRGISAAWKRNIKDVMERRERKRPVEIIAGPDFCSEYRGFLAHTAVHVRTSALLDRPSQIHTIVLYEMEHVERMIVLFRYIRGVLCMEPHEVALKRLSLQIIENHIPTPLQEVWRKLTFEAEHLWYNRGVWKRGIRTS